MAGRGPRPKDASKRVRRNADPIASLSIFGQGAEQPDLPVFTVMTDSGPEPFSWPERTREWWSMWRNSELSRRFTETDWSELLDTAVLHARYWSGDFKVAAELRLRTAKFGATPEDRARLRIEVTAPRDDGESRQAPSASVPDRYASVTPLRAVGD